MYNRYSLLGPILISFFIKCIVILLVVHQNSPQAFRLPDTGSYFAPAVHLAHEASFRNQASNPEFFRTPGYPVTLVPGILLKHPLVWGIFLQVLYSLLIVYITGRWGEKLWGRKTGVLAAWLIALDPLSLAMSMVIMSDMLFACLVLASLYLFSFHFHSEQRSWQAVSAILLGVATLVKPVSLYLAPLLVLFGIFTARNQRVVFRKLAISSVLFLLLAFLPPTLWIMRNSGQGKSVLSTSGQVLMNCYVKPAILADVQNLNYYQLRQELGCNDRQEQVTSSVSIGELAMKYPMETGKQFLTGLVRGVFDPGTLDMARILGWYPEQGGLLGVSSSQGFFSAILALLQQYPLAGALLFLPLPWMFFLLGMSGKGLFHEFSKSTHNEVNILMLLATAYFLFFSAGPGAVGRYRLPIMAFLALWTARGSIRNKE